MRSISDTLFSSVLFKRTRSFSQLEDLEVVADRSEHDIANKSPTVEAVL